MINDEIKVRDIISVTITLDGRYTDGPRAASTYKKFVNYLNDPDKCDIDDNK